MSPNFAYATLITRATYLAGVVILAYSLRNRGSKYPLVVLYTNTLSDASIQTLEDLKDEYNILPTRVDALLPDPEQKLNLAADRFADTWTKLRVFQLVNYKKICYLDADMLIFKSMDTIFDIELPGKDWLAAAPVCCCNPDQDSWAPADWVPENCPYTEMRHPSSLNPPPRIPRQSPSPYHLLNSGLLLFEPSCALWKAILHFFETTPLLSTFTCPDQDLLSEFFKEKWIYVGWQYNAIKTMKYWHSNIWRDDEVCCLHYIVDNPWEKRVGPDGIAGYLNRDGETHRWWWKAYDEWKGIMERNLNTQITHAVDSQVAK